MKTDFDILIIGGGLVGASLACALRESGLRLGVIEAVPLAASTRPSYDVQGCTNAVGGRMPGAAGDRTLALAWGSKQIFESMGCWQDIVVDATPIEHIHISDRGRFGITRLSAVEAGLPALGYVVPNRALGAALLKTMQAAKNIEWFCPAEMQGIHLAPESATVTVRLNDTTSDLKNPLSLEGEGGGEGDGPEPVRRFAPHPTLSPEGRGIFGTGSSRTLTARLVIAADGAHSAVRAALGIEAERTEYCQSAVVTTVTTSEPHGNTAYERFTDTGPLALLPLRKNECAVVWSAKDSEVQTILGWSDAEFLEHLQDRFGDRLGAFTRLGKRAAWPLALTRVPEQVRERLALIGNAAHTVHPVAGQGFNLGLRDVASIAEILTDAARASEDIGNLAVLRRYADWRQRDNQITAGFTNGLIRVFSNSAFPLTFLRNAGLLAVDLMPGVKRSFVRVTSGLAGRLPRLARGLPL